MSELTALEKLTKGRVGLILDQPFFGQLCWRMPLRENTQIETCATNGKHLMYNPEFVEGLSLDEVKGVLAHEVMHVAMAHHVRQGARQHGEWNRACDYAINDILLKSFTLPQGALSSPAFSNMSAEEIYPQLPDSEDGDGNGSGFGEVIQMPSGSNPGGNLSRAEIDQEEADVRVAVAQAAQAARVMGSTPAGMERIIDEIINPSVDWRAVLRDFMERVAKNDYSWERPNRRYVSYGFYLPDLYSKDLGNIKVAIDTSCSVSDRDMQVFAGEVSGILSEFPGCSIDVMYCDSKLYEDATQHFEHEDLPVVLKAQGGGGTDFRPVFDYIAENGEKPTALIYLTDMCGDFPDEDPGYPVLWGATGDYSDEAPFGELLKVKITD